MAASGGGRARPTNPSGASVASVASVVYAAMCAVCGFMGCKPGRKPGRKPGGLGVLTPPTITYDGKQVVLRYYIMGAYGDDIGPYCDDTGPHDDSCDFKRTKYGDFYTTFFGHEADTGKGLQTRSIPVPTLCFVFADDKYKYKYTMRVVLKLRVPEEIVKEPALVHCKWYLLGGIPPDDLNAIKRAMPGFGYVIDDKGPSVKARLDSFKDELTRAIVAMLDFFKKNPGVDKFKTTKKGGSRVSVSCTREPTCPEED